MLGSTTASNNPSPCTTLVAASMNTLYRLVTVQFATIASHSCKSRGHSGVEAGAPKGLAKNAYPHQNLLCVMCYRQCESNTKMGHLGINEGVGKGLPGMPLKGGTPYPEECKESYSCSVPRTLPSWCQLSTLVSPWRRGRDQTHQA